MSVLGTAIGINDVLDALNVVVSTVEHSNVTGNTGGFAVKASFKNTESDATADDVLGDAGGFAGKISGGHIQDSNAYNFSYVVGQITAGGYVGDLEPGNVASVLGDASILDGLVSVKDTLASVAQDFCADNPKQFYHLHSMWRSSPGRSSIDNRIAERSGWWLCRT